MEDTEDKRVLMKEWRLLKSHYSNTEREDEGAERGKVLV